MARSLNLARRQLNHEAGRQLVADQLRETPSWSNRRVAKAPGVDHHTAASVRVEIEATAEIPQFEATTGRVLPSRPVACVIPVVHRNPKERQARIKATTTKALTTMPGGPAHVARPSGTSRRS